MNNRMFQEDAKRDGWFSKVTKKIDFIDKWIRNHDTIPHDGIIKGYGRWTPTLTNTTNIDTSSSLDVQYIRIGDEVSFCGVVTINATVAGVAILLQMSLPIPSTFSSANDANGVAASSGGVSGVVLADLGLSSLRFVITPTVTTDVLYRFSGMYRIR